MMKGEEIMKCLKIENGKGYFRNDEDDYQEIDKISKEDILYLLNIATSDDEFEMDACDDVNLKNEAHKIIYRSLHQKFSELLNNKTRFKDECSGLFQTAIEKYSDDE